MCGARRYTFARVSRSARLGNDGRTPLPVTVAMPLPPSYNTRHVVGTYLAIDGAPPVGRVIFEPTQTITVGGVTVFPASFSAPLVDGAFEIDLPTTDDPDLNVRDWCYRITEAFTGGRSFYLRVPAGAEPLDMAMAAPVVDPPAATQLATVARTGQAADLAGLADAISAELVDLPLPNAVSKVAGLTGNVETAALQTALGLKPVALSGDYTDLAGKPAIPAKTSDLANDSGFLTAEADPTVPAWAKQQTPPTYTKADVGLGNVDNTSDAAKPVSAAQAAALAGKVDAVAGLGLSSNDFTDADAAKLDGIQAGAQVNVPQVQADWNATEGAAAIANKPAIPTSAADVGAVAAASVGQADGVAPLDSTGKVPASNLPPAPASGVQSVVAGDNVTVDNHDPAHPVVSAEGGGVQADWNAASGQAQILNQPPFKFADSSILLGPNANHTSSYSICIGNNASANGGISIGSNSKAGNGVALGTLATSTNVNHSVAIGRSATCTDSDQAMIMAAGATVTTGGLFQLSAYTVASLNAMSFTTAPLGCVAFATDALDVGEATAAGTGCVALRKTSGWVRLADNTPLAT